MPSRALAARHAVTSTTESPKRDDDGAAGLLGELSGFEAEGLAADGHFTGMS